MIYWSAGSLVLMHYLLDQSFRAGRWCNDCSLVKPLIPQDFQLFKGGLSHILKTSLCDKPFCSTWIIPTHLLAISRDLCNSLKITSEAHYCLAKSSLRTCLNLMCQFCRTLSLLVQCTNLPPGLCVIFIANSCFINLQSTVAPMWLVFCLGELPAV